MKSTIILCRSRQIKTIRGWSRRLLVCAFAPIERYHFPESGSAVTGFIPLLSPRGFSTASPFSAAASNTVGFTSARSTDDDDLSLIKVKILEAAIPKISNYGWTLDALAEGAKSIGLPPVTHGLFPSGGVDLVAHVYRSNNRKFMENLVPRNSVGRPTSVLTGFLGDAIQSRLRLNIPCMDSWTSAIGMLSLPQNLSIASRLVGELMDDIWYSSGDHSVNANWYTKRLALVSVYEASELFMLQDKSPDYMDTWQFLARRVEDFGEVYKLANAVKKPLHYAFPAIKAATTMLANITGLNQWRQF